MINYISNQLELGLSLLIYQYREAPNLIAILTVYLNQIQYLEDISNQLLNNRNIFTATGGTLDVFGQILDADRMGFDDETYRVFLFAKIAEIMTEGTIEDLINVYTLITRASKTQLQEIYPAGFFMTAIDPDPYPFDISFIVDKTKAAGVGIEFLASAISPSFSFADDPDPNGAGWGDANDPEVGGYFSTILT